MLAKWPIWQDQLGRLGSPEEASAMSRSGGPRRAPVKLGLEEGIDGENLGETTACSQGVQRRAQTARGRPGGDESTGEVRRLEEEDDGVAGVAGREEASASAGMTRATRRS